MLKRKASKTAHQTEKEGLEHLKTTLFFTVFSQNQEPEIISSLKKLYYDISKNAW